MVYGWSRWSTILRMCEPIKKKSLVQNEQDVESLVRTILAYALKHYHGEESIRQFCIDMIDPSKSNFDALRSHEGLAAPVARARRRVGEQPATSEPTTTESIRDLADMEWAKNAEELLGDEGYKRHLVRQASKILLRLRTLFYIKHEIIGDEYARKLDDRETSASALTIDQIDLQLPDVAVDLPAEWWDVRCDQSLLVGVYKHGFERYYQIRVDPSLCFLQMCGEPDANEEAAAAAAEAAEETANGEADGEENAAAGKEKAAAAAAAAAAKVDEDGVKHFPSHHELNNRLRRLIAIVQKHKKQQQLAEKRDADKNAKRSAKLTAQQERASLRQIERQIKWSRREEQNFYKAISTYGYDCVDAVAGTYFWDRFKVINNKHEIIIIYAYF